MKSNLAQYENKKDPYYDEVWARHRGLCAICNLEAVAIHEIVPKSKYVGDWRVPSNRVPLCASCHAMVHRDGTAKWEDYLKSRIQTHNG